jgi:hypothetical protein
LVGPHLTDLSDARAPENAEVKNRRARRIVWLEILLVPLDFGDPGVFPLARLVDGCRRRGGATMPRLISITLTISATRGMLKQADAYCRALVNILISS